MSHFLILSFIFLSPGQLLTSSQDKDKISVPWTIFLTASLQFIYTFGIVKDHEQLLARDLLSLENTGGSASTTATRLPDVLSKRSLYHRGTDLESILPIRTGTQSARWIWGIQDSSKNIKRKRK